MIHAKAKKYDILPCSGPIWTIPTPQYCILLIRSRGNARGGWWHRHRTRTGVGKCRRWPGDFFGVAGGDGCREGSDGWIDGISISGDAFRCWEEEAKGLGSIGWV